MAGEVKSSKKALLELDMKNNLKSIMTFNSDDVRQSCPNCFVCLLLLFFSNHLVHRNDSTQNTGCCPMLPIINFNLGIGLKHIRKNHTFSGHVEKST